MHWQFQLITIYLNVCYLWREGICESVKRYSNNNHFALSDEEIATIYFFGILSGYTTVRGIYDYTDRHLREWFPCIGSYEAFCYRLNRICDSFPLICKCLVERRETMPVETWVVDSFPIVMAGSKRSGRAKVASEQADKGFCASKDMYFYGVKLHCVCAKWENDSLPLPHFIGMATASASDHKMFEQVSPEILNGKIFADKAYIDTHHKIHLAEKQNLQLITPIKKQKEMFSFKGPDAFSTLASSIRQPIESLFNWLQEKTKIQNASKVRSSAGVIVHVFGRIAAALMIRILFNP